MQTGSRRSCHNKHIGEIWCGLDIPIIWHIYNSHLDVAFKIPSHITTDGQFTVATITVPTSPTTEGHKSELRNMCRQIHVFNSKWGSVDSRYSNIKIQTVLCDAPHVQASCLPRNCFLNELTRPSIFSPQIYTTHQAVITCRRIEGI